MAASQLVRRTAKAADQAVFGEMSGTRMGVRHGLLSIVVSLVLGACSNLDVVPEGAPPAPTKAGVVFQFSGFNLPRDTYTTSGAYTLARKIRSLGVRAEIDFASQWEVVAERYLAEGADPASTPIAVVGYSLGAGSAIEFARKLGRAGGEGAEPRRHRSVQPDADPEQRLPRAAYLYRWRCLVFEDRTGPRFYRVAREFRVQG
jgi:hypothetical protein